MNLTLAITVYNRYDLLLESFTQVIDDPRIDEILISDDCSKDEYWNKIKELPKFNDKIKVVRQLENRGMSYNKMSAIANSKNSWVIIFDSDNVIGKDYLDAFFNYASHNPDFIYCPTFAKPNFDYRKIIQPDIDSEDEDKKNGKNSSYQTVFYGKNHGDLNDPIINCFYNTCNYIVNREKYLSVWKENPSMKGSDTIWFAYLWLKEDKGFFPVRNMHYFHRVHQGSGFMQDFDYNMKKGEEIKKLIMAL